MSLLKKGHLKKIAEWAGLSSESLENNIKSTIQEPINSAESFLEKVEEFDDKEGLFKAFLNTLNQEYDLYKERRKLYFSLLNSMRDSGMSNEEIAKLIKDIHYEKGPKTDEKYKHFFKIREHWNGRRYIQFFDSLLEIGIGPNLFIERITFNKGLSLSYSRSCSSRLLCVSKVLSASWLKLPNEKIKYNHLDFFGIKLIKPKW